MKLVGMGLEPGVPGLTSYMSLIKSPPTSITMLRWWFTLNYDSVQTSQDHLAFNIRGQGVKVESENEHLTADRRADSHGRVRAAQSAVCRELHEAF